MSEREVTSKNLLEKHEKFVEYVKRLLYETLQEISEKGSEYLRGKKFGEEAIVDMIKQILEKKVDELSSKDSSTPSHSS